MTNFLTIDRIIKNALEEDINYGDITTENIMPKNEMSKAYFLAKADGVVAGINIAERVFEIVDKTIKFKINKVDGTEVKRGDIIAEVEGSTTNILLAERTALNFLQRMSGIATETNKYVKAVAGKAMIVDTRKTVPGLRILDKYAVKAGGGRNHRINLSDAVMIKDNHIEAAGGITKAVEMIRSNIGHTVKIEVEVKNMEEVKEAVATGVEIIMLDNMNTEVSQEAIKYIDKRAIVEASGNMNLEKAKEMADIGVDVISIGALTHSVTAMDISMKINKKTI